MADRGARLVLASASAARQRLLAGAGLSFDVVPAHIDERAIAARLSGLNVPECAKGLAEAKALAVSALVPESLVIGADQMLELDGEVLSKAPDVVSAKRVLECLRDRTHQLHSGVALARDGQAVWSVVQSATLHVRGFSDTWLTSYIERTGTALTKSVGGYEFEGLGVQLFECIEGDYFTILGLPLLPLLAELRRLDAITS